jgi:hypothetical protein
MGMAFPSKSKSFEMQHCTLVPAIALKLGSVDRSGQIRGQMLGEARPECLQQPKDTQNKLQHSVFILLKREILGCH